MRIGKVAALLSIACGLLLSVANTFANTQPRATKIIKLRVRSSPTQWRLVFDLTKSVHYHYFTLAHPNRLVIDLANTQLLQRIKFKQIANSPVTQIRTAEHRNHTLRIVLDLTRSLKEKVFILPPSPLRGYRLVVDLLKKSSASRVSHSSKKFSSSRSKVSSKAPGYELSPMLTLRPTTTNHKVAAKPKIMTSAPSATHVISAPVVKKQKLRNVVVVVDPGHGGIDPGATGPGGTHEKTVVLAIGRDLARTINRQPGFRALLTRKGNYYIPLRKRLSIARKDKADMFISIHADAYKNRDAQGASVFALSQRGATSEAARWLAARENQSELMGGVNLNDKGNLLKSVLINLSQTATIRASLKIGGDIIQTLHKVTPLHHPTVEQAAFVVLKSPDIPSLLVETGFISNPKEERMLKSSRYQHKLASAIMRGIKDYFRHHPPRGTWLAYWRKHPPRGKKRYIVKRGDTLLAIAERYGVSLRRIRRLNQLSTNQIRVGQVLVLSKSYIL